MRRLSTFTKITATAAVLSMAVVGCAKSDTGSSGSSSSSSDVCDTAKGSGPKVGIAYDVGGRGDQSFNDSAYAGLQKAVKDLGATCTTGEAQDGEPESAREDRLRQMAEAGYNPVIGIGFSYSDAANAVAPDYPKVSFAVIDGFDPDTTKNSNVAYLDFASNEGSFLVGAAAALKTKTDHIGFVGGVHNDLIKTFEAGYTAGAKAVNPNIKVGVKYIEETDVKGFDDPQGGQDAANALYQSGADVVFQVAGGSGAGVFTAAVDAGQGKWAIGVDSDQYLTASKDAKPHILTSMIKHVDVGVYDMIKSVADNKPLTGYQTFDLKSGGVGYATSGGFVNDIKPKLDAYAAQIKSGKIKVPTTPSSS